MHEVQQRIKLVTVDEMVQIEKQADARGHTYAQMMEHAGTGLGEVVHAEAGALQALTALGLVGSGNNGGDTLVALAHLAQEHGWRVTAYIVRPRPADDPLVARVGQAGGEVLLVEDDGDFQRLGQALEEHAVLLDGVLGTGARLPLRGVVKQVLEITRDRIAALETPPLVVAVDCPSGVDCRSGEAAPEALPAWMTVTMAAVKEGMLRFPAFELLGQLRVVGIGLPDDLEPWQAVHHQVVSPAWVRSILPPRPKNAHKGTFGTVMVVGGSVNYTGAVYLTGMAAYRVGAGLVTLAVPGPLHAALAGGFPEATWLLLPHEMGVIAEQAAAVVVENLERVTALALGPGFGLEETSREFLALLTGATRKAGKGGIGFIHPTQGQDGVARVDLPPLVVDADGLKLLARIPDWPQRLPTPAVLTPHPGEMAVLTGLKKEDIQADRIGTAERCAADWGHVVVLKGACTVVASPAGETAVVPVATPALARAGTGDVLTGLIAGLRAQGVEAFQAAVAGVWLHAQAGLLAEQILGNPASVLAGDVLDAVADVISDL